MTGMKLYMSAGHENSHKPIIQTLLSDLYHSGNNASVN